MTIEAVSARPDTVSIKPSTGRRQRTRPDWIAVLVILVYVGAAIAVMGDLWADPSRLSFVNDANDPTFFEWMLWHGVSVLTHGANPFHTDALNVPLGVNLMANTNVLALALPLAPLTVWLGPYVVYALIFTAGLAGTAYAWYHVMYRHFIGDRVAAIIGGAICGFGPGIIAHTNGHPNITAQFLVPLILLRALELRRSDRLVRDGLVLGVLIVVQAFINEEILLDTALAGLVFTIGYTAFRPGVLQGAGRLLRGAAVAALCSGAALAYPLWQQFTGAGHVNGLPLSQTEYPYRLPLSSFVTLPGQSLLGDPVRDLALSHPTEQNSFLGWPVVVIAVAIVIVLWRSSPAVRALAIVGGVFTYASLGDRITVADPSRSYPYSLWSHVDKLPVFDSILPTRLALVVLPLVGLLFAHGIAAARRGLTGRPYPLVRASAMLSLLVMAGALVTVIPTQPPTTAAPAVPRFFLDGTWQRYVPSGYTVLSASPLDRVQSMRWAVATGGELAVSGGYFFGPDATGRARYGPIPRPTTSLLRSAERGTLHKPHPATIRTAVADLRYWRTAIIVLAPDQPGAPATIGTLNGMFGPGEFIDGVHLWDVRPITTGPQATYAGVGGRAGRPLPLLIR